MNQGNHSEEKNLENFYAQELRKYQAVGTVEECRKAMDMFRTAEAMTNAMFQLPPEARGCGTADAAAPVAEEMSQAYTEVLGQLVKKNIKRLLLEGLSSAAPDHAADEERLDLMDAYLELYGNMLELFGDYSGVNC